MSVIYLVFLELLAIAAINISFCNGSTPVGCIESERLALLRFKQDLKDPLNRLASWNGDGDCCTWDGVVCHNFTGHVLELHLRNPNWEFCTFQDNQGLHIQYDSRLEHDQYDSYKKSLFGRFNYLQILSLTCNQLQGRIPSAIGNLTSLRALDFSQNELEGKVSRSFGRLCNLRSIILSHNNLSQAMSQVLDIFSTCINSDKPELLDLGNNHFVGSFVKSTSSIERSPHS